EREVADNAMLVLQVIVQPKPLCREMFAYDRHPQVRSILAAIFFGRGKAPVARGIRPSGSGTQQLFPLVARQALIIPVGPAMFAAMVKEADIVISLLKRFDLRLDKGIQFIKIGLQVVRYRKIHIHSSSLFYSFIFMRSTGNVRGPVPHIWGYQPCICL